MAGDAVALGRGDGASERRGVGLRGAGRDQRRERQRLHLIDGHPACVGHEYVARLSLNSFIVVEAGAALARGIARGHVGSMRVGDEPGPQRGIDLRAVRLGSDDIAHRRLGP